MYYQKWMLGVDEKKWFYRILVGREFIKVEDKGDGLCIKVVRFFIIGVLDGFFFNEEDLDVDFVICVIGYKRMVYVDIFKGVYDFFFEFDVVGEQEQEQIGVFRKDWWVVESVNKV